jgi:hypothetical protein
MEKRIDLFVRFLLIIFMTAIWFIPAAAGAHCDTLDGPVGATARAALEKGDITPVLKWVKNDDEAEIRAAFKKTLSVRSKGAEAKELADMYFFETLVRIHRAGEGAAYAGLKPAGMVEPSVAAADKALAAGTCDDLVKMVTNAAAAGVRERFERVKEAQKHADESVGAGREYVEAYVDFTHYVERLHVSAASSGEHHAEHKENKPETHGH